MPIYDSAESVRILTTSCNSNGRLISVQYIMGAHWERWKEEKLYERRKILRFVVVVVLSFQNEVFFERKKSAFFVHWPKAMSKFYAKPSTYYNIQRSMSHNTYYTLNSTMFFCLGFFWLRVDGPGHIQWKCFCNVLETDFIKPRNENCNQHVQYNKSMFWTNGKYWNPNGDEIHFPSFLS